MNHIALWLFDRYLRRIVESYAREYAKREMRRWMDEVEMSRIREKQILARLEATQDALCELTLLRPTVWVGTPPDFASHLKGQGSDPAA